MITFKAIIIPGNRRKDGTYPVNIRVTFKGKTRRLPTTLSVTQGDLSRSLKIKNATILNKTDALIAQMRDGHTVLPSFRKATARRSETERELRFPDAMRQDLSQPYIR